MGQFVVDELAKRLGASFSRHNKANARTAEGRTAPGGPKLVLAKSNGYMNTSGGPVSQLVDYYGIDVDHVVVVHDELDLPFDTLKLKVGGGHGGHNGLRDISAALGDPGYLRVRVGIGRPPGRQDAADFVLKDFAGSEREVLPVLVGDAADAVELIASEGMQAAQLRVHTAAGA